jgi:hypothetical protein
VLVRALFENGGTGDFRVFLRKSDNSLIVVHSALGPITPMKRAALVVFLDRKPDRVLHRIGGAL